MSETITLPVDVSNAKLPMAYESAKHALEECDRVDECQSWANKAAALASYARQAKDETLHDMARRIQVRAIRRAGELLKQIEPQQGGDRRSNQRDGAVPLVTRTSAADGAGLSERQRKTALRVADVPEDEFEEEVERERPPTVTALAARGTRRTKQPKPTQEETDLRSIEVLESMLHATSPATCWRLSRRTCSHD